MSWRSLRQPPRGRSRSHIAVLVEYSLTPGSRTKNPPLIQPFSRSAASRRSRRPRRRRIRWPKRAGGRTTVMVASLPCERWNASRLVEVDVGDAVAVRQHERARRRGDGSARWTARRSSSRRPVSTRSTIQSSSSSPLVPPSVTSPLCRSSREARGWRAVVEEVALDHVALVAERDSRTRRNP